MGRIALAFFFIFFPLHLATVTAAPSEGEILPPFGLRWGEDAQRLESLLKGAKATVVDKRQENDRDVWTVEGIVQNGLRRTLFYLQKNQLIQVELQYQGADWDTTKYESFMASIRQRLDAKYGPGQLIVRSKTPEGLITQTLVGYKWSKTSSSIQLVYFSAEDANRIFRTVSIHYHAAPSTNSAAP